MASKKPGTLWFRPDLRWGRPRLARRRAAPCEAYLNRQERPQRCRSTAPCLLPNARRPTFNRTVEPTLCKLLATTQKRRQSYPRRDSLTAIHSASKTTSSATSAR